MNSSSDLSDSEKKIYSSADRDIAIGDSSIIYEVPEHVRTAEAKIIRKFDLRVLPLLMLLQMISFLDRSNIGNAKVFGYVTDLKLKGIEFNNISTVYYATYVAFEIPVSMCVKRFGANHVLGFIVCGWALTTLFTCFIQNYRDAIITRLVLGACEAGLFPSISFYVSSIWTREQQAKRMSGLYGAICFSGAFGGLLAFAIQQIGKTGGLEAWRWLFILEGLISLVVGIAAWLTIPKTVDTAKFLNTEERRVMSARLERERAYNGVNEPFAWSQFRAAISDGFVWLASLGYFFSSVSLFGFSTFAPSIINELGYTSLQANYLTIPIYVWATMVLVTFAYLSDKLQVKAKFMMIMPLQTILGYAILLGSDSPAAGYFACFFVASGIYIFNTLMVTWIANNVSGAWKRAVAIGMSLTIANSSGIIGSQLYTSKQAPKYKLGNAVSLGSEALAIVCVICAYFLLRLRESKKEKLRACGAADDAYGPMGDQALTFRYKL